jgi:hypothetical protein
MSAHMVVLPTPTSVQAVFTETANGRAPPGASKGMPVVLIVIAR